VAPSALKIKMLLYAAFKFTQTISEQKKLQLPMPVNITVWVRRRESVMPKQGHCIPPPFISSLVKLVSTDVRF